MIIVCLLHTVHVDAASRMVSVARASLKALWPSAEARLVAMPLAGARPDVRLRQKTRPQGQTPCDCVELEHAVGSKALQQVYLVTLPHPPAQASHLWRQVP